GAPTVVSFALPTLARLRSESNGAHSRRCSGSVSAFQTFAGEWESSRTRTSVHFSPSFRTSAPEAGPGVYCSRLFISFFFLSERVPCPSFRGVAPARRGASTRSAGRERANHRSPSAVRVVNDRSAAALRFAIRRSPPLATRAG